LFFPDFSLRYCFAKATAKKIVASGIIRNLLHQFFVPTIKISTIIVVHFPAHLYGIFLARLFASHP